MTERIVDDDIRRLLTEYVPPLPAPEDRLGEVGARVWRYRRRRVALGAVAAAATVTLVGVPAIVLDHPRPAPPVAAATCPPPGPPLVQPPPNYTPGPLLPTDATRILVCQVRVRPNFDEPAGPARYAYEAGWTRTVEREVPRVVAGLNALPDRPTQPLLCLLVLRPHYVLMVEHPRGVERVDIDSCFPAVSGNRVRQGAWDMVPKIRDYDPAETREEVDPATYRAPDCPIDVATLRPSASPPPYVGSDWTGRLGDPLMPDPLMLARACRYVDRQLLTRQPVVRSNADSGLLARLQDAIAADQAAPGGSAPACGDPPTTSRPTLDVLLVVGPTASYGVISIERDRCTVAAWLGTSTPPGVPFRTIAIIDGLFGPPN